MPSRRLWVLVPLTLLASACGSNDPGAGTAEAFNSAQPTSSCVPPATACPPPPAVTGTPSPTATTTSARPTSTASTSRPTTKQPPGTSSAPAKKEAAKRAASSPWTLRWADEFNGGKLNLARWVPERESTYGDGNSELACLTDRPQNLRVAGGALHIVARREAKPYVCGSKDRRFPRGRTFTSAMVSTKGTAAWKYGRFEVRAKTATATGVSKGLWAAAWFRPTTGSRGEIDLLEALGTGPGRGPSKVHQALHNGVHHVQENDYSLPSMASSFHTYAVEWEPDEIRWYVDGKLTWTRDASTTPLFASTYNRPYYLRLNLAVGGSWPGAPLASTRFPAEYVVDYVRVYAPR